MTNEELKQLPLRAALTELNNSLAFPVEVVTAGVGRGVVKLVGFGYSFVLKEKFLDEPVPGVIDDIISNYRQSWVNVLKVISENVTASIDYKLVGSILGRQTGKHKGAALLKYSEEVWKEYYLASKFDLSGGIRRLLAPDTPKGVKLLPYNELSAHTKATLVSMWLALWKIRAVALEPGLALLHIIGSIKGTESETKSAHLLWSILIGEVLKIKMRPEFEYKPKT